MSFKDYLNNTTSIATEEKEILDILSKKDELSPIEIRAAKNSMQVLVENDEAIFLKTIIPSRVMTKKYLKEKQ
ncbi:MAG: hypothetical protein IE880_08120 [Epsilonproteobacteria bacterium]|nr:hypothetical protein [Campylobacterota bacterium]